MKIDRRTVLAGLLLTTFAGRKAHATDRIPFDAAAFQAAQDAGKTIVLQVTAKWCGPCQRQRPVVANLLGNPDFSRLMVFDADYDLHKEALVKINALHLTTLIIYRGKTEFLRSSGETRPEMVEAFLRKAI
jgi:thiol-disulfide isomerase/thioredoxin